MLIDEGEHFLEKMDFDKVVKKYKEAIARINTQDLNNYKTIAKIFYRLIHIYNLKNNYDEAILLGYEGQDMLRDLVKAKHVDVGNEMFIQLYCEMSYSFIHVERWKEAQEKLELADKMIDDLKDEEVKNEAVKNKTVIY